MVYSLVAGSALALVNLKSMPRILENRLEAENAARKDVLPGMDGGYELTDDGSGFPYWTGYRDTGKSDPGGYIFIAREKGYSSTIESMVGVDTSGAVTGVIVLFQQETPGLGARIEEIRHGEKTPWFTRQFIGKSPSDTFTVAKDGGDIDSITGATISSRAVSGSIGQGLQTLQIKVGGFR